MGRTERPARTANVCASHGHENRERAAEIVCQLARLLAPFVAAELRRIPSDDWVDQTTSPLDRKRHCKLAKAQAFPAHKEGRRWLARRSDIDAYIEACGSDSTPAARPLAIPATRPANDAHEGDPSVEAALAEVGLELAPMPARPRKGRP